MAWGPTLFGADTFSSSDFEPWEYPRTWPRWIAALLTFQVELEDLVALGGLTSRAADTVTGVIVTDASGNALAHLTPDARTLIAAGLRTTLETDGSVTTTPLVPEAAQNLTSPLNIGAASRIRDSAQVLDAIGDQHGNLVQVTTRDGVTFGVFEDFRDAAGFRDAEIAGLNAWAATWSQQFENLPHQFQGIEATVFNHVIGWGESFMAATCGVLGTAYLTGALRTNTIMFGTSEHSAAQNSSAFARIGTGTNPLAGTVLNVAASLETARVLLNNAAIEALGNNAPQNSGESAGVMGMHQLTAMAGAAIGAGTVLCWTNLGRGGANFENWLPGGQFVNGSNVPQNIYLFNRFDSLMQQGAAEAAARSLAYRVTALVVDIGRNNYGDFFDGTRPAIILDGSAERTFAAGTEAEVLARLRTIRAAIEAGPLATRAGQGLRPAVFIFMPGESYTRDNANLGVAQGIRRWAEQDDGVFLIGPEYQFTDVNHLDFNGYRAAGCKLGQVMDRVLVDGKRWRAFSPLRVLWRRRTILVACHVPAPPIQFAPVWRGIGYVEVNRPDRGFRVLVNGSPVEITGVDAPADRVLRITLAAEPATAPVVQYAPLAQADGILGNGNVADSDATVAQASYVHDGGINLRPEANIAALVGQPYRMNNFLIPFHDVAEAA